MLVGLGNAVSLRATAFDMHATDTVANVTLSTTPTLITRQRQNLGEIRSRGVEADAEGRIGPRLVLAAGITFLDTRVLAAPDPVLVGKRVPQVPRRQGGAQIRYDDPKGFTFGVQARFSASQYDDDLNSLQLRRLLDARCPFRAFPERMGRVLSWPARTSPTRSTTWAGRPCGRWGRRVRSGAGSGFAWVAAPVPDRAPGKRSCPQH